MTEAMAILGCSTAALAVWCIYLSRRLRDASDLLNQSASLLVRHSELINTQMDALMAVRSRLDSVQDGTELALTLNKR